MTAHRFNFMNEILDILQSKADVAYRKLQSSIVPNIPPQSILGVRVPELRKLAKSIAGTPECNVFLANLPHTCYDENMLHGILISQEKDFAHCLKMLNSFLPYVDNWAVCDTISPKVFAKHKAELLPEIKGWLSSEKTYTVRFGIKMLMAHFLEEDFSCEHLRLVAGVVSNEYYINMMIAWYMATALAKQWNDAVECLTEKRLGTWTHNKTIQKAMESYRITPNQKAILRTLKIKRN